MTPRVAGLVIVALALTLGAYLGLGKGSHIETAAAFEPIPNLAAVSGADASFQDLYSFRTTPSDARLAPPAAPTTAPVPTPVVAGEVASPPPPPPTPQATPTPPPVVRAPVAIPADGIEAIICALPWPCEQAIAVAACESGRNMAGRLDGNYATNGNNYGLFQINGVHASRWPDFYQDWMDPAKNAQWAYEIWAQQGWYPWDCRWAAYS